MRLIIITTLNLKVRLKVRNERKNARSWIIKGKFCYVIAGQYFLLIVEASGISDQSIEKVYVYSIKQVCKPVNLFNRSVMSWKLSLVLLTA